MRNPDYGTHHRADIYPAEGIIREQIYRLQLRCTSAQENAGKLAVISIRLDGSLNDETNLNFQEWERIQHQNAFCDQIYTLAQQMEAAVFSSNNSYFIVTTRSVLTNFFLKNDTHSKLMQFHRRHPDYSVWIGIGMGSTMLKAKSRSLLALNRSVTSRSQNVYLIEDDSLNLEALQVASNPTFDLAHFTHQTGISAKTLGILKQAISLDNAPITAAALAERMGITERSVNRIIALLEDNGCVSIVGKVTTGKGRPARSMKITLPDYIIKQTVNSQCVQGEAGIPIILTAQKNDPVLNCLHKNVNSFFNKMRIDKCKARS